VVREVLEPADDDTDRGAELGKDDPHDVARLADDPQRRRLVVRVRDERHDRPDSLPDHRGQCGQDRARDLRRATDRIEGRALVVRVADE
jgi:hypothetical protein